MAYIIYPSGETVSIYPDSLDEKFTQEQLEKIVQGTPHIAPSYYRQQVIVFNEERQGVINPKATEYYLHGKSITVHGAVLVCGKKEVH